MGVDSVHAVARPTNTQFALAVHMLTLLAASAPEQLSSEEMAGSAGSNPVHVRRVLGGLREAGLVTSRPGVGGGWSLVAQPAATTLADVWRVVQRDDPVLGLRGANPDCSVGQGVQAALLAVDRRAAAAIEAELATTTVADLVADTAADLRRVS
jgi:Rrf2 family protein